MKFTIEQIKDIIREELEEALSDAERKEIEKFFPGRKITSPEDVEKRRKEREQEASMPKDKAPPAPRPKKRRRGSKYRPYGRST